MKVVIIEDEAPAAARLQKMLAAAASDIEVVAVLDTLAGARVWLRSNPAPDLIFMDIQLSDGLSVDMVRVERIACPVVFVTAYDEYWQEALEYNGIDYLLKPVKQERLEGALRKYTELAGYFADRYKDLMESMGEGAGKKVDGPGAGTKVDGPGAGGARAKFLVRRGTEFVSIRAEEIAFFYASHKLVCLVRKDGAKFILDHSLAEIEKRVDPGVWFRLNRKYLVSAAAIRKVNALPKSKLLVEVEPVVSEDLVVSSENNGAFKKWLGR